MTPSRLQWLALLSLASAVSLFLLARSRTLPSLRPAAHACLAFVVLDAARLGIDVAGGEGWRGMLGWADVGLFVMLSAPWAGLLAAGSPSGEVAIEVVRGEHEIPIGRSRAWGLGGGEAQDECESVIHACILPAAILACYASLLLLARHHPAVAGHWQAWLAAPRLAVGAWALWVAMRGRKDEGPGSRSRRALSVFASPRGGPLEAHTGPVADPGNAPGTPGYEPGEFACSRACNEDHTPSPRSPQPLPPSVLVGIVLTLSAAASVVGGLWPTWGGVRVVSAAGWVLAAVVGWRAR